MSKTDPRNNKLIKNTIIIFMGKACTQLIAFLLLPLYTKYLITEDYGIVDLITTYISLITPLITLEIELAVFRFLIERRNSDNEEKDKIISTSIISLFIVGTIVLIIYFTVCSFLNIKFKYLIGFLIYVNMFSSLLLQIARGIGDNIKYSVATCINGISAVIFNVIFIVFFNLGALGMILGLLISNILMLFFLFLSLRIYNSFSIKWYDKKLLKSMLKYSIALVPNGLSWWIVNASDRTIISYIIGVGANGLYAVSNKFSSLYIGVFNIFLLSWTETASVHINDEDVSSFFSKIINNVLRLGVTSCVCVLAVMRIFFRIMINKNYAEAYNYISILFVAMIFNMLAGMYSAIYVAKKKTKNIMYTSIISAIINIVINLMLIKAIGIYAAAVSTLIAYLCMFIYRMIDSKKYVQINFIKRDVIVFTILIIVECILYYINNVYIEIINIIIMFLIFILMNANNIKSILNSIKERKKCIQI